MFIIFTIILNEKGALKVNSDKDPYFTTPLPHHIHTVLVPLPSVSIRFKRLVVFSWSWVGSGLNIASDFQSSLSHKNLDCA